MRHYVDNLRCCKFKTWAFCLPSTLIYMVYHNFINRYIYIKSYNIFFLTEDLWDYLSGNELNRLVYINRSLICNQKMFSCYNAKKKKMNTNNKEIWTLILKLDSRTQNDWNL